MFVLAMSSWIFLETSYGYQFEEMDEEANDELAQDDGINDVASVQENEAAGIVKMEGEFLEKDLLKISITAEDMQSPVLGLAYHLLYEPEQAKFLKYVPGEFLEKGGDPFYLVKNDDVNNRIIFGETLRSKDTFPLGGGEIVEFYFELLDGEHFDFRFENGVVSSIDESRQDIDKIVWGNFEFKESEEEKMMAENNFDGGISDNSFGLPTSLVNIALIVLVALAAMFMYLMYRKISVKNMEQKRQI